MGVEFKAHDGTGWVTAPGRRWDGSVWASLGGAASAVLDTLRQVTDGAATNRAVVYTGGAASQTYGTTHTVRADATDLTVTYGHNTTITAGITLGASIEHGGTITPLTFGGQPTTTLAQGTQQVGALITSDPAPITVRAGDTVTVRTWMDANTTGHPRSLTKPMSTEPIASGNITGGGSFTSTIGGPMRPLAVTGKAESSTVSVVLLGDSIMEGGNATTTGFGTRAATGSGLPFSNLAFWGNSFPAPQYNGVDARLPDLAQFTHALVEYGINDVANSYNAGRTVAYIQDTAVKYWTWVGGQGPKVYQTTLVPGHATSTDSWASVAGQSPGATKAFRDQINAWIRDGAPLVDGAAAAPGANGAARAGEPGHPLAGWLEVGATVETGHNTGLWVVDPTRGCATNDGTHPTEYGHELMAAPVATWLGTLTA